MFFNMIMMETRQQYIDIKVKMKNKVFSILLVLLLIMSLQAQGQENKAQEIPTSKVGDLIKGKNYKVDQGRSFHLIHVPSLDKKYLFFSLKVDEIYSHLEFSISIYKQGSQTPFKKCLREQVDSCYIQREQITLNQTIFLVIDSSGEQCDYQIRSYWSNLEHIILGKQVKFLFAKEEQKQIYHLELDNPNFNQLRIIIKPQTRRLAFDKIKMYGTFGKDSLPSADNHDFKSSYLWQDTQGIFLSKKQVKQLKINLILYGEVETVYTMLCEVVNKTHSDLALNNKIYEYLEQDQSYTYHLDFKGTQGQYNHDLYVFTMAIFTGDFQVQLYTDNERQNRVNNIEPLMFMGDIQYIFSKDRVEKLYPSGIYVHLLSKKRVTTFMLELEGRNKDKLIQLDEHIYQFMQVNDQTVAFFQVSRFGQENSQQVLDNLKVVFSVLSIQGKVGLEFRQCKATRQECISPQYANYSSKINNQYRNVGSKDTYSLTLTNDFWKNVNPVEKNAIVLVVLTRLEKTLTTIAIEYNIGNRVEFLRQNKPIQSHVLKNQFKTYKFVNTDPNIESIRLHFNKISGCFSTYIFREQPNESSNPFKEQNKISGSIYQISDKLIQKPIVILIMGEDSATFSLSVQPIHRDLDELDFVTVSEDVNFKFKIAPNMYEVLEIVPILNNIFFTYQSTGALHVCVLKDGICQDKEGKLANEGEIEILQFQDRNLYVKLRNPSSSRSIEVNTLFHSKIESHCELKQMSHIYQEIISPNSCFRTIIDQAKDFEVSLVRQQVGKLSYTVAICDKLLSIDSKENGDERYHISAEQLIRSCQGHAQYSFLFSVGSEKAQDTTKIRIKYLIQYTDSLIILPDGIGYHGNELTTEQAIKKFTYPLLNKIDTTIVLTTQKKLYFLIKFIQSKLRDKSQLSINSFDFSSPMDKFYYLESIYLKITQQMIQKSKCIECQILIYVYSKEDIGTIVDFTLEVTQNFFFLEEASPKSNYLTANSKAYYGFKIKQTGTLLIELSDNNLGCSQLYLSSSEYPDQVNNLVKSFDGQIIKDVVSSTKVYYITVRARKACAYTITASLSTGKNHITKLQRGNLGSFNMGENETKFYTFKHLSDQSFKVLSLHKYGQVQFYLNKTTPDAILSSIASKTIDFKSFTYHSPHKNRLILDKTEKQFCKNCMYILAVHAKKHTVSSIFLGDQQTKIPLSEEKVLNDILLKKNSITRGELYFIEKGIVEVKVHSGKLQLELNYKGQNLKTIFSRSQQLQTYNFTLKQQNDYRSTISAVFTALEDNTIYSSRIKSASTAEENADGIPLTNIDPSSPNYIFIEKGQPTCFQGFIKRSDERIFISFHSDYKDATQQMRIVGKINGNFTPISQDTTKNVISIAFLESSSKQLKEVQRYQICLSHETQSLSLTVLQSQQTSLLPENTEMMVANKQIFDIYPQGDFMLDIFECRGSTKIRYGSDKKELQESKPKILDLTGIPNQPHAVHLQDGYSNLLLSVEGELSLVRWLRINQDEQKGLGYYVYEAGMLRYNSVFGEIQVIVGPVKQKKKAQTQITSIRYNLYISNNLEDLKYASNCEKYLPNSVIDYEMQYNSLSTADFKFTAKKTNIKEHFPKNENLFFTVVADVTVKTTDQSTQEYRFVYQSQQMPAEVFTPNQLEKYQMKTLIIVLVLFIVAILTCSWVFARVIVPLISRLRNSLLVEENGENSKDKKEDDMGDNIQVPPSSDRQGIHFNDLQVAETEQKM